MIRTIRTAWVSSLLIAATGGAPSIQETPATAVLLDATSRVSVLRVPGTDTIPGASGIRLAPGSIVVVPPGSAATILFRGGKVQRITSTLTIPDHRTGDHARLAAVAASALRKPTRTLGRVAAVRPIAGAPAPISPVNGITVLGVRPAFTWFNIPGGAPYTIQLQRVGSHEIRRYAVGADTTWTLPWNEIPLSPGEEYQWTILPSFNGRVAQPAVFAVVGPDVFGSVAQQLQLIDSERGILSIAGTAYLKANVFFQAGLLYESLTALHDLASAEPVLSQEARDLFEMVKNRSGGRTVLERER